MTDTLAAPSWESDVLPTVPSGFLAHDWQPATGGRTFEVRNPAHLLTPALLVGTLARLAVRPGCWGRSRRTDA
ncbi:hypothetical protein ABZ519_22820 [Streptomyces collinus]|uniref:hypothetical protein n=1 Tax=Streptomyces collinus TaxID=42684 RepID=UPI0033DB04FB